MLCDRNLAANMACLDRAKIGRVTCGKGIGGVNHPCLPTVQQDHGVSRILHFWEYPL